MQPNVKRHSRAPLRWLAAMGGIGLFAAIVQRAGVGALWHNILVLRWTVAIIIALAGISHVLRTYAWRLTLGENERSVSIPRLLALRLISEAGGQLGFVGQMFGDAARVSLMNDLVPTGSAVSSVVLDRGLFLIAGSLVTAAGVALALIALPFPARFRFCAVVFLVGIAALLVMGALVMRPGSRILSSTAQKLRRIPRIAHWVDKRSSAIDSTEDKLFGFSRDFPRAFWGAFVLNVICQLLAVVEVGTILFGLGAGVTFLGALFVEALTKLVNFAGALNPGNIGTYEGGTILITSLVGIGTSTGLTLGIVRRLRSLFWAAVGAVCLLAFTYRRRLRPNGAPSAAEAQGGDTGRSVAAGAVAVFIANQTGAESLLTKVGTLPVLLRALLGANKAGADRLVVLLDERSGDDLRRNVVATGRVPASTEWVTTTKDKPLSDYLRQICIRTRGRQVMLIAGDRIYDPALLKKAGEWRDERTALMLTTDEQAIGIYSLPTEVVQGRDFPACSAIDLARLDDWLRKQADVTCESVEASSWQRIASSEDREIGELKLNRWLVKPTDGFFAKTNRRISIPISRQIIRFPITPNMVSIFVLGVSFSAGVFFARGGYLNTLLGAALSVFSSILDGCDGEVARLKIQYSALGCWLDTVCDYLYYVFIFVGLTLGLTRSSGSTVWLSWGVFLLFGAVMTFLATAFSRHRLAQRRPEELLKIWHKEAENRKSNPFLALGRHTEFLVRRAFMPYGLLAFAVLDLTKVVFILCAIGANVAWMISLYSCLLFTAERGATTTPAVSASTT